MSFGGCLLFPCPSETRRTCWSQCRQSLNWVCQLLWLVKRLCIICSAKLAHHLLYDCYHLGELFCDVHMQPLRNVRWEQIKEAISQSQSSGDEKFGQDSSVVPQFNPPITEEPACSLSSYTTFHQNLLRNCMKINAEIVFYFFYFICNCDLEWRSRSSTFLSTCRCSKKLVCKCLDASQH